MALEPYVWFFQWHPIPMSRRGPSGCSPGRFWGPSGHSLATHLPLTCRSLTSCGPPRSQQLQKKAQRSVLVRACLENPFLRPPESAQCAFFTINTICFEGSENPQECNIQSHFGSHWHPCQCESGKIMSQRCLKTAETSPKQLCYTHVMLMLCSCYAHVTLMLRSCSSLAPHLPLTCNKNLWSQCASRQKHAIPNGYWTQSKKIK